MPDNKLTDNEIVRALECCASAEYQCQKCTLYGKCYDGMVCEEALDLINRQKVEIESLKREIPNRKYATCVKVRNGMIYTKTLDDYDWLIGDISAEAIKEFAERLKETFPQDDFLRSTKRISEDIDNLVKEMVGDEQ